MATQRQIAANQRNALLSTGLQSEAGKARSRLNSIKHGLTARQVLLAGESQEQYDQLRQAVFEELMPDGVIASQLADALLPCSGACGVYLPLRRRCSNGDQDLLAWVSLAWAAGSDASTGLESRT